MKYARDSGRVVTSDFRRSRLRTFQIKVSEIVYALIHSKAVGCVTIHMESYMVKLFYTLQVVTR